MEFAYWWLENSSNSQVHLFTFENSNNKIKFKDKKYVNNIQIVIIYKIYANLISAIFILKRICLLIGKSV